MPNDLESLVNNPPAKRQRSSSENSDKSVDNLIAWLLENGAEINCIEERIVPGMRLADYADSGAGRGLFITKDVDEGQVLIRVPAVCLLNLDTLPIYTRYPAYDRIGRG